MNALFPDPRATFRDVASPGAGGDRRPSAGLPVNRDSGFREAGSWRRTIHRSSRTLIEDLSVSGADTPPSGFEDRYQVILPYLGLFEYHVGRRSCQIDTASTLFVDGDHEYRDVHPIDGIGHAGVVITIGPDLVDEIIFEAGSRQAFAQMTRPATLRLKLMTHQFLRSIEIVDDPLFADELTYCALSEAFAVPPKGVPRSSKALSDAKRMLHEREGERLSLDEIAEVVGVSGVYLTQEFSRVEGIPLYRYQLLLRMNRALLELPHSNDITGLALDLGFSSHSHFSSAFRRHFGVTPSEFRSGRAIGEACLKGRRRPVSLSRLGDYSQATRS